MRLIVNKLRMWAKTVDATLVSRTKSCSTLSGLISLLIIEALYGLLRSKMNKTQKVYTKGAKMRLSLNGRPIEVTEFDNDDDIPLVLEAFYLDGAQEELTEDECYQAVDANYQALAFAIYEKQISAAEAYYEGDR